MFETAMHKRLEDIGESQKTQYKSTPPKIEYPDKVDEDNTNKDLGRLVLMIKDPWTIYSYLDLKESTIKQMKQLSADSKNKIKINTSISARNNNYKFKDSFNYNPNSTQEPNYYFKNLLKDSIYVVKFNIENIGEFPALGETFNHGESPDTSVKMGYGWRKRK